VKMERGACIELIEDCQREGYEVQLCKPVCLKSKAVLLLFNDEQVLSASRWHGISDMHSSKSGCSCCQCLYATAWRYILNV
jgi:hypothetical protein